MVPRLASISFLISDISFYMQKRDNSSKKKNFFTIPHGFEELFGNKLRPSEKYFYVILRKLSNRYADQSGWFWHIDQKFTTHEGKALGLKSFGFSPSFSKRARKKLLKLSLIETRRGRNRLGHRAGTYYRLIDSMFNFDKEKPEHFPEETNPKGQNELSH